mgnify:CR=1 FL=1
MRFLLVTGVEESNRDEITGLALRGVKKSLPNFRYLRFSDIMNIPEGTSCLSGDETIDDIHKIREKFRRRLKKMLVSEMKKGTNVIVSTYLTLNTRYGYLPLLSCEFFSVFRPDMLVLMEVETDVKGSRVKRIFGSRENLGLIEEQQRINREYAVQCLSVSDSFLKILRVQPDNIKRTLREVSEIIRFGVG